MLDLSKAERELTSLFSQPESHPTRGQCVRCARVAAKILKDIGYDVEIVQIENRDFGPYVGRPPVMTANDPNGQTLVIATDGYHQAVRINGQYYLDALVYLHYGVTGIAAAEYFRLTIWDYPFDIEVTQIISP